MLPREQVVKRVQVRVASLEDSLHDHEGNLR